MPTDSTKRCRSRTRAQPMVGEGAPKKVNAIEDLSLANACSP